MITLMKNKSDNQKFLAPFLGGSVSKENSQSNFGYYTLQDDIMLPTSLHQWLKLT